ncbi:glutathione S-transferase [Pseudovibrio sp. SPO723]|uniref:glutathione S-transferase family protein n=1 Tax=Nesiotobacter zosterae TaxID=392721 RepID=UPI0029C34458|nr:glutathione S-transferase [Pseudovibrio sp. SPO723]MDX5592477.1 glutathione S-transferase [Pseudovibrio sp. SPO723]
MSHKIRVYRHALSGHCHRVELFLALNNIPHELVDVDLVNGEHKKEPFLTLNPHGRVPVIVDGDAVISDSNAILVYLARKYAPHWLATDLIEEAEVNKYLTLAASEINHGPAAARLRLVFGADLQEARTLQLATWAFEQLDKHLAENTWVAANKPTVADVALYTYSAHAPEGNISLEPYANLRAYLKRIEALPGFVPMQATKVGLAA